MAITVKELIEKLKDKDQDVQSERKTTMKSLYPASRR